MFSSIVYHALRVSGLTSLARQLSKGSVILCYHNIVPSDAAADPSGIGLHLPFASFERQMRWLASNYEILSLETCVDRLARNVSLRGSLAITFDDAYEGVFEHAWPLLSELGIPATAFVVADAPGRDEAFWWDHRDVVRAMSPERRRQWLTKYRGDGESIIGSVGLSRNGGRAPASCRCASWEEITCAARSGLALGAHSATHRSLPTLDDLELRRELEWSREEIARRTGVAPAFFAYPYGLWNTRVRDAVAASGYRAALTLDHGHVTARTDPFVLPRLNVPAGIADAAFEAWTAGLRPRRQAVS